MCNSVSPALLCEPARRALLTRAHRCALDRLLNGAVVTQFANNHLIEMALHFDEMIVRRLFGIGDAGVRDLHLIVV